MFDRNMMVQELLLREQIRKAIKITYQKLNEEKRAELNQEQHLRKIIRRLIAEGADGGAPETPHRSTGINVLEDLLRKIVPILEDDFKILTTDPEQRKSYRSHIVNAVQNALAPEMAINDDPAASADGKAPPGEVREEVDVMVGDDAEEPAVDDMFIDVRDSSADPELSPEEEFAQGADPESDKTGRNLAMRSFKKVEKALVDAYAVLDNEEDRQLFYDYLLTNLKLYFDKFDEELQGDLDEPSTPEYEQEVSDIASAETDGGEAAADLGGGEEDLGGLDLS
jgi:hypothetical protein